MPTTAAVKFQDLHRRVLLDVKTAQSAASPGSVASQFVLMGQRSETFFGDLSHTGTDVVLRNSHFPKFLSACFSPVADPAALLWFQRSPSVCQHPKRA